MKMMMMKKLNYQKMDDINYVMHYVMKFNTINF